MRQVGEEHHFDLVLFLESYLMIARVTVQEGEQYASGRRVDDLIDSRECKRILWTVLVEVSVVDAHHPLVVVLFKNEDRIHQPLGMVNFLDEPGRE